MEALQRLHNRGSISTGYDIDNSCKFEEDNSESLWKTFSSEGTGTGKTFTISGWVKRTELGGIDIFMGVGRDVGGDANDGAIRFNSDQFQFVNFASNAYNVRTNAVFRDTSAWYHIMVAVDTTQGTDSNRVKLYVNGEQQTSLTGTAYPTQNYQFKWGRAEEHMIGARPDSDATAGVAQVNQFWSGYMADVYFIDGLQLAPTDFGEYDEDSGIWKPIEVEDVTYGTNGFYLDFADASDLGDDESGNGNDFTLNNITAADQATDTPTNNFATLNPLHAYSATASYNPIVSDGATRWTTARAGYWAAGIANMGLTSGKWYFEAQPGTSNTHITSIGWGDESDINDWAQDQADTNGYPGENGTNSIGYLGSDTSGSYGNIWLGTGSTSNVNANYTISNIVGVALDVDNGYAYFAKDNTYVNSGNPGSGSSGTGGYAFTDTTTTRTGTVFPAIGGYYHIAATVINVNFGGFTTITISSAATDANGYGTFEYAPPSGYYALCTKNLEVYG